MHLILSKPQWAFFLLVLPLLANAETAFITDQIKVGIHAESNLESPILKLVNTGTQLDVKQRGVDMSQVSDADGTEGWINTAYLVDRNPNSTQTGNNNDDAKLQTELAKAQSEIQQLKTDLEQATDIEGSEQVKALRIEIGELQAQLTEQRKLSSQMAMPGETTALDPELSAQNVELQQTVDELQSQLTLSESVNTEQATMPFNIGTRQIMLYLLLPMVVGMGLGIFLYDVYKRHQHGGFRV